VHYSTHTDATFPSGESVHSLRLPPEILRSLRRHRSFTEAWDACSRADWLVYIAASTVAARGNAPHIRVVRAASACARKALHSVPEGDDRPRIALDMVDQWCAARTPLSAMHEAGLIARKAADARWTAGALAAVYTVDAVSFQLGDCLAFDVRNAASQAVRAAASAQPGSFAEAMASLVPVVRDILPPPYL